MSIYKVVIQESNPANAQLIAGAIAMAGLGVYCEVKENITRIVIPFPKRESAEKLLAVIPVESNVSIEESIREAHPLKQGLKQ